MNWNLLLTLVLLTFVLGEGREQRGELVGQSRVKRSFFIAEGTNWCGQGNKAKDCFDVGRLAETDQCCREHDYCPYTFAPIDPLYNGYETDTFHSVSHCECDQMFFDCLQEKPYKKGSSYIMSTFKSIADSCFAYLPCNETDPNRFQNIWTARGERRVGKCHQGFKVMVFDSTEDYHEFMKSKLNMEQLELLGSKMTTNTSDMMSTRKKNAPCLAHFQHIPQKLAKNFETKYILPRKKSTEADDSGEFLSLSLVDTDANQDDKANKSLLYALAAHQKVVSKIGNYKLEQSETGVVDLKDLLEELPSQKQSSKGISPKSIIVFLSVVGLIAAALAIKRS